MSDTNIIPESISPPEFAEETVQQRAASVVGRYVNLETGSYRIGQTGIHMQDLIDARIQRDPALQSGSARAEAKAGRLLRQRMSSLANDAMTRMQNGRVVLDLDGSYRCITGRNWSWTATDVPSIVFCETTEDDKSFDVAAGRTLEAIAVYFDPSGLQPNTVYESGTDQPRRFPAGTILDGPGDVSGHIMTAPKQRDYHGYLAVVAAFEDINDAEQAQEELYQAVQTLSRPPVDEYEPDPVAQVDDVERASLSRGF